MTAQIYEKELLAVIYALTQWRHYLLGADLYCLYRPSEFALLLVTEAAFGKADAVGKHLVTVSLPDCTCAGTEECGGRCFVSEAVGSSYFRDTSCRSFEDMVDQYATDTDFADVFTRIRDGGGNSGIVHSGWLLDEKNHVDLRRLLLEGVQLVSEPALGLQRRINLKELDNEALAFQPVLGSMLAAIYYNPRNKEANQTRLQKILQFWGSKEVYSKEIITALEKEMIAGPPAPYRSQGMQLLPQQEKSMPIPANLAGIVSLPDFANKAEHMRMPSPEHPHSFQSPSKKDDTPSLAALAAASYGGSASVTSSITPQVSVDPVSSVHPALNSSFLSSLTSATAAATQPTPAQLPASARAADHPPYPLFPPGLIPGMIRKMQIGTGVPYSALSPLDIPAVIPPSTASDSYILSRVAKFFKEIGEVDPLEGQVKGGTSSMDEDEREERDGRRTGGACIPPPGNLNVDPETNTLPDGSIEHKPGSISTGRLGLGAVADPNEITQYDDVYTSYRKQRSTSYHTFMSARAAAR
ncbi:hypothetical protein L7F22_028639 [Adiantum nelumboides]|nr:hypothetical protein [Adiantum nelumboides]